MGKIRNLRSFWLVIIVALLVTQTSTAAANTTQSQVEETSLPRAEVRGPLSGIPPLSTFQAAQPQANGVSSWTASDRVVFQSYRDYNWEIYFTSDSATMHRLTNDSANDLVPKLNRDSTRIVFESNRTGNYELYTINPDGTGLTQVTNNLANSINPAWSPDGSKIAFQSDRDGQDEIYIINANGSGLTRVTNRPDYDGMPSWSPDGNKLTFVSRQTGGYRIYTMFTNGTGVTQLNNQAYSEDPIWSPDGRRILYDADANNDGWQELWIMASDGSGQALLMDEGYGHCDLYSTSWSPNGIWVADIDVHFISQYGHLYWTIAQPYKTIPEDPRNYAQWLFITDGMDWFASWSTVDPYPPVSSMVPLPAFSPSSFKISWSGTDIGASGLKDFDVQVKDGVNSPWTNWMLDFPYVNQIFNNGIDGHTYYFRVRARDNAENIEAWRKVDTMTTVDSQSPLTWVNNLPSHIRSTNFDVSWDGTDHDGSGINAYSLQVKTLPLDWVDWQKLVTIKDAIFTGTTGHTYCFRVQGVDNVQNMENWKGESANACSTLYGWSVNGLIVDNRDVPIMGAGVNLNPQGFENNLSNENGVYSSYAADTTTSYQASWSKSGYSTLPVTNFDSNQDAALDIVLPPLDNVIQNWGFEQGDLGAWTVAGDMLPTISSIMHTGQFAAQFGNSLQDPAPQTGGADSTLSQSVLIPSGMNGPTLSFYYKMSSAIGANVPQFSLSVTQNGTTNTLLSTGDNTNGWQHAWFDLSQWAGQNVLLTFNLQAGDGQPFPQVNLDEITLGSAHPDVWVKMTGPAKATKGQPLVFHITYGNRGKVPANNVVLTESLPAGMTFVSASVAPTTTSPLVWNVGDLPAGSGPYRINLTTTMDASVVDYSTITNTINIATLSPELETLNNGAHADVWVGAKYYLPVIGK